MDKTIGIIGLGNIGFALSRGLSISNLGELTIVYDHNLVAMQRVKNEICNIKYLECIEDVFKNSDLICVCIRTNQLEEFLTTNSKFFTEGKTVVFLSSAVKIDLINKLLTDSKAQIIRGITNINISSCCGYTFVLKNKNEEANKAVSDLFRKVGKVDEVETEFQLDLLSLLSGCTPAIIALFYELLVESGVTVGVSKMQAAEIIEDTIHQTLINISNNNLSAWELRQRVCTSGGIVAQHLKELENETNFSHEVVSWLPKILATLPK